LLMSSSLDFADNLISHHHLTIKFNCTISTSSFAKSGSRRAPTFGHLLLRDKGVDLLGHRGGAMAKGRRDVVFRFSPAQSVLSDQ
ncbi:MAG: hypothetical protein M3R24_32415, partial [Chloroflexota bacterium]|nr:hypothetical protein [Chloroflexota bacterium]